MNILGYETLRLLILTSAVFSFCAKMYIPEKDVVTFWKTGGKFVLFLRRFAYYNSKLRNEKCLALGCAEGVADNAAKKLEMMYPGLQCVGTYSPPFDFEKNPVEMERIAPDFTFFATAGAASLLNAQVVLVDIDERTFNLSPRSLEEAIQRTLLEGKYIPKAIIAVDL